MGWLKYLTRWFRRWIFLPLSLQIHEHIIILCPSYLSEIRVSPGECRDSFWADWNLTQPKSRDMTVHTCWGSCVFSFHCSLHFILLLHQITNAHILIHFTLYITCFPRPVFISLVEALHCLAIQCSICAEGLMFLLFPPSFPPVSQYVPEVP